MVPEWPVAKGPRILSLVANDMTIDTRVRKTARSLSEAGCSVIAIAHDDLGTLPRQEDLHGALMHRVCPSHDPRLSLRFARLSPSEMAERLRRESELQRQRLQLGRRDLVAAQALKSTEEPAGGRPIRVTNGLLCRLGIDNATRVRVSRGLARITSRLSNTFVVGPRRTRVKLLQRRHQLTTMAYRAVVRAQLRRPAIGVSWRRDLPEMHKWEAAIGPLVDQLDPDLIHTHDIFHLGLAVRAKARARLKGRDVKVLYDAHEFVAGLPGPAWRRAALVGLEEEYIHDVDAVVTVSQSLSEVLHERYGMSAALVMNAPDRGPGLETTPLREVVGVDPADIVLAYVGGLAPDRGAEVLITALTKLDGQMHVVFVTNARAGYRTTLELLATDLGVADRVHFAPYVASDAVSNYIASVDVSVIPLSRDVGNYEVALPNKLFQSIHAGVPVVVSDNPEMARFVPEFGIGEVFAGGDPASLAAAVERLLDRRESLASRLKDDEMLDELSWERQIETLLSVYGEAGVPVR